MRIVISTALCLLAILWVPAAYSTDKTIVVVGDSLSSGFGLASEPSWVAMLADRLDAQGYGYAVVNASIAGDTTAGGLSRLPQLLDSHQPEIVVIELGGNDGLRGQSLDALRSNLSMMIEIALDRGAKVLLAGIQIPPNYGIAYTQALANIYPQLATAYSVPLVGFFMDGVALQAQYMQRDRVHPNAAGQAVLLDNVWPILTDLMLHP